MSRTSFRAGACRAVLGRMRRRAVALVSLVAVAALVGAGCGSSGDDGSTTGASDGGREPFTVGVMALTMKSAFFVEFVEIMRGLVEEKGGEVLVLDARNDPTNQLQLAQTWLNGDKVDVLLGGVVDINSFQPAMDLAEEKEVPFVTIGIKPRSLGRAQTVIDQDFKEWGLFGGQAMARCIDERLGGRAEVAILTGPNLPGPVVNDRIAGIEEGIAQYAPDSRVVAKQDADLDRLKALQVTKTILQAHPEVRGFTAVGDEGVLGSLQALKSLGEDPTRFCLIGMDNQREGLAAFEKGEFYSEMDLNLPELFGLAVDAGVALMEDPDDPRFSGRVVVTRFIRPVYPAER